MDIKVEELNSDFPKNNSELGYKWLEGDLNGLKVGDRVEFKYVLNLDGMSETDIFKLRNLIGEKGTISKFIKTGFRIYVDKYENCKDIIVNFDNDELNKMNDEFYLIPMQFVKIS